MRQAQEVELHHRGNVLGVGGATVVLDAGLIGPATFSALVLMALVSTAATMPLTRFVARNEFSNR